MRALSLLVAGFVALLPAVANAGDPAPAADAGAAHVVALEAAVQEHAEKADVALLTKDIPAVTKAYKDCTDPKLKARLMNLLGAILGATKDGPLSKAAIAAMGSLGDADAWRFLKEHVKQPNPKEAPPLLIDAIAASSKVRAEPAVEVLLVIVDKSKLNTVAIAALKALGSFGESKRYRLKILERVIASIRRSVPGRAPGQGANAGGPGAGGVGAEGSSEGGEGTEGGEGSAGGVEGAPTGGEVGGESGGMTSGAGGGIDLQSRWRALSPVMVLSLDALTGQKIGTPTDWFDMYDRYKKSLETLFTAPAAK